MLVHCAAEIAALADLCSVVTHDSPSTSWTIDLWRMDDQQVDLAVSAYAALLNAGTTVESEVAAILRDEGIDLQALLTRGGDGRDLVTRADLCELVLAASIIAVDEGVSDRMYMPNIPKMSRRKSDSGVDVFEPGLDEDGAPGLLSSPEFLGLTSVKHSIANSTSDVRLKLQRSVSEKELGLPYMAEQLRVLGGRMQEQGWNDEAAKRVFLFLRAFPDEKHVRLTAGAVVDSTAEADILTEVKKLPDLTDRKVHFRIVSFPGLLDVHERCP